MNCFSKKNVNAEKGFSLPETVAALIILSLFSSGVLVVLNRCMASVVDLAQHRRAFEIARNNMEMLLTSTSVEEMTEIGDSNEYPEIQWQKTIETFSAPVSSRIWAKAICSAEYTDSQGEVQIVELIYWLTSLTEEQLQQLQRRQAEEEAYIAEEIVETVEEAADYAGVDTETIEQWVKNGMPKTKYGFYIKDWLDLYEEFDGEPPADAIQELKDSIEEKKKQEGSPGPKDPKRPDLNDLPEDFNDLLGL